MQIMKHSSAFLSPSPEIAGVGARPYALVVLNQHIPRFTPIVWNHAEVRLFADGGSNRVFDGMPELFPDQDPWEIRRRYKPDVIKGDMDSIRPEVKDFYLNLGVKIVDASDDQDTTDLHKCIDFICNDTMLSGKPNLCILVLGALGGRFDHEAGNINVLHMFSKVQIVLLSDDCLIHLLPRAYFHEIDIQFSLEGPHCGLIPIGAPSSSTTTTGLQWDLSDTGMSFGGLISTSNLVRDNKVTVRSDADLLWTISIKREA